MPRDTVSFVEAVLDLATPSLAGLAWLLRHKEAWPVGFRWNFANCPTCAIGLAYRMICGEAPEDRFGPDDAAVWLPRAFPALSDQEGFLVKSADKIFFGDVAFALGIELGDVTPEMVAQRIEDHLAGRL